MTNDKTKTSDAASEEHTPESTKTFLGADPLFDTERPPAVPGARDTAEIPRGFKVYDAETHADGSMSASWSDPTSYGRRVRHFKGGEYLVMGKGYLEVPGQDKGEPAVIYMSRETMTIWIRSEKDFTKEVRWPDGKIRTRFMADSSLLRGITSTGTGKVETEEAIQDDPSATLDVLSLVLEGLELLPTALEIVTGWTPEERTAADLWAATQIALANDLNPDDLVEIPPKPVYVAELEAKAIEVKNGQMDQLRSEFVAAAERAKQAKKDHGDLRDRLADVEEKAKRVGTGLEDVKRQGAMLNDADMFGRQAAQSMVDELKRISKVDVYLAELVRSDEAMAPMDAEPVTDPRVAMGHLIRDVQYRIAEVEDMLAKGIDNNNDALTDITRKQMETARTVYEDMVKLTRDRLGSCIEAGKNKENADDEK